MTAKITRILSIQYIWVDINYLAIKPLCYIELFINNNSQGNAQQKNNWAYNK